MSNREHQSKAHGLDQLQQILAGQFESKGCELVRYRGELTLEVPVGEWAEVALALRDDEELLFEELIDVCGVDYAAYGMAEWDTDDVSSTGFGRGVDRAGKLDLDADKRFAAVYHLLSISLNQRLRVRVFVDTKEPIVPSMVDVWASANWFEREAFDLYGILFEGHPDLRRILTDYGFVGHPFRKDFPLVGHLEMRYDPDKQRVVYEPANIEPRTLVPRVVRAEASYKPADNDKPESTDA